MLNKKLSQFSSFAGPVPNSRQFKEDKRKPNKMPKMGTEEDPIIESDDDQPQVRRFREKDTTNHGMYDDIYGEEIGSDEEDDDDIPDLDDMPI